MPQYTLEEHRARFYGDVESLLDPGFVTMRWKHQGRQILFRSLLPADFQFISEQVSSPFWHRWLVACSIYSIDGRRSIDPDYDITCELAEYLATIPSPLYDHWLSIVLSLNTRSKKAMVDLAPYLYENRSRERWKFWNVPKGDSFAVHGIEHFGLNPVQRVWSAWNKMEDARERMMHEWDLAKMVLSGFVGKGVRTLDEQDKVNRENEKDRRALQQDKWLFDKLDIPYIDHTQLFKDPKKKTWEDLEREMEAWIAGEKDFHDRVIDDYMNWIDQRREEITQQNDERVRKALEMAAAAAESIADAPLVGYTMDQLKDIMPKWNPGVSTVDTRRISELP